MASWLVVGCGYTGSALVAELRAAGEAVAVTRRTAARAAETAARLGVTAYALDVAADATPDLPSFDVVVALAPPGADPAGEIARILAVARGARKLVYVSSTGVYPPAAGAWVDETWPLAPTTAAGRGRVRAEAALAAQDAIPWVALRAAGIYGPGRGVAERIRAGTYRIIGDGTGHVSRIHVADLVAAIRAAARSPVTGAVNVADDDPAPIGLVADTLAAAFGCPPPPRVAPADVDPEVAGMLGADRRIANRRLREELGVDLRFPSWRASLPAATTTPD